MYNSVHHCKEKGKAMILSTSRDRIVFCLLSLSAHREKTFHIIFFTMTWVEFALRNSALFNFPITIFHLIDSLATDHDHYQLFSAGLSNTPRHQRSQIWLKIGKKCGSFSNQPVETNCNEIWPGLVPFGANLTHFGSHIWQPWV